MEKLYRRRYFQIPEQGQHHGNRDLATLVRAQRCDLTDITTGVGIRRDEIIIKVLVTMFVVDFLQTPSSAL